MSSIPESSVRNWNQQRVMIFFGGLKSDIGESEFDDEELSKIRALDLKGRNLPALTLDNLERGGLSFGLRHRIIDVLKEAGILSQPGANQPPRPVTPGLPAHPLTVSTPSRRNSGKHMISSTARQDMDKLLSQELRHHMWITEGDEFFDRFFPPDKFLPERTPNLPKFPTCPIQSNVFEWFKACTNIVPGQLWEWRYCSDGHKLTPKRLPDVFLHYANSEDNWKCTAVVGELKYRFRQETDLQKDFFVQLSSYAKEIFAAQPSRGFAHGFMIVNNIMRCWVWTRSGAVGSRSVDLSDDEDTKLFWRIICYYSSMTSEDLGFRKEVSNITIGDLTFKISGEAISHDRAIISRGTTVWGVNDISVEPTSMPLVLKEAWRYENREVEGELLSRVNIKGIARYRAHEEKGDSVHNLLGEGILEGAKSWSPKKRKNPFGNYQGGNKRSQKSPPNIANGTSQSPSNGTSQNTSTSEFQTSNIAVSGSGPLGSGPSPLGLGSSTDFGSKDKIFNRIKTSTVLERGVGITEWHKHGGLALLRCFEDAICGHRLLLQDAKILHRDVSINNIMISLDPSHHHGFLIDLDLAVQFSDKNVAACGAPERTGTYEFMSICSLRRTSNFCHCYYDDLESFFWVLLYVCNRDPHNSPSIHKWSNYEAASDNKIVLATDATAFDDLLNEMNEDCKGEQWKELFRAFRHSLFGLSSMSLLSDSFRKMVMTESKMKEIYDGILEAFKKATEAIEG